MGRRPAPLSKALTKPRRDPFAGLEARQLEMRTRIYRGWDRLRDRPKDGRSYRGHKGSPRGSEMAIGTEEKDVDVLRRQARFLIGRNFSRARIANQLGITGE